MILDICTIVHCTVLPYDVIYYQFLGGEGGGYHTHFWFGLSWLGPYNKEHIARQENTIINDLAIVLF